MVVNESKTDLCIFHSKDCPPVVIELNGGFLISKKKINVFGVTFDSKLQWVEQVALATSKAMKALSAIKIIKQYFTKTEILQLVTSNVMSILYYNSEIWHIPTLKQNLKQKLLSVSARAIKTCMYYPDPMISFMQIHALNNRALPESMRIYNMTIQLHKLYNSNNYSLEWVSLNKNLIMTSRQRNFAIMKSNNRKVGMKTLTNRLSCLNGLIPLDWLNGSIEQFKIKCKRLIL